MSTQRRTPPHDLHAEQALIGACLLSREALTAATAEGLDAADFYAPACGRAWQAATEIARRGDPVDVVTVSGELDDGPLDDLLRWQTETPSTSHAATYARRIVDLAVCRAVISAGREISDEGWLAVDGETAVLAASATVAGLARPGRRGPRRVADVVDDLLASWQDDTRRPGVGWGIAALDAVVQMRPGELHIVGARTGVGKSSLLLATAAHAARHHGPVLVVSLEMTAAEVAARLLAHRARAQVSAHVPPADRDDEQWRRITRDGLDGLGTLPLWIDDSPTATVAAITAAAAQLAAEHGPLALVVVDYAQLIGAGAGRETRQEEVAAVTRGLKTAARTLDCPILAASQLRRPPADAMKDPRPRLSDLRESGAIEQDADTVLLLHRPPAKERRAVRDPDLAEPERIDIHVAKNRHGPSGQILQCSWYPGWALIAAAGATTVTWLGPSGTSEPRSERLPYRD